MAGLRKLPLSCVLAAAAILHVMTAGALVAASASGSGNEVQVIVDAPPELVVTARRIGALDRSRLDAAVKLTGLTGLAESREPLRIWLVPEDSDLARNTSPWVAGFAQGSRAIVLFPERTLPPPYGDLEELVHHEAAHVFVARATGGRPVPRWFNEGLATIAGSAWRLEDQTQVALELLNTERRSLAALDAGFLMGKDEGRRSYALSAAFVRSLMRRHGETVAAELLASVRSGATFATAFERVTGETLAAAEQRFWKSHSLASGWIQFLLTGTALWLGVTLLALAAIARRRRRNAAVEASWEAEEAAKAAAFGESDELVN